MKLYTKRIVTLMVIMTMSYACNDDLLDVVDQNRLNPEVFWQTAEHANQAVVGAYSPLATQFYWGRMMILFTVYRSDAANPIGNGSITQPANFSVDPQSSRMRDIWREFWKPILRANTILQQVPNIEDQVLDMSPNPGGHTLRENILGEAYFLRALQNFYAVTMFRNVPLIVEVPIGVQDSQLAPSEPNVIWQQIIEDLKLAKTLLPTSWDDSNIGRATWGAATTLLGKSYLYRSGIDGTSDFAAAATEFKAVMDSGLYELTGDQADNFSFDRENNEESIFEIQLDGGGTAWGADNLNGLRTAAWEPDLAPPGFTSQRGLLINEWVKDAFLTETTVDGEIDPRAFNTIIWDYPGAMVYQTPFTDAFTDLSTVACRKYLDFRPEKTTSDFGFGGVLGSERNWRLMRYADVLLMYAEAENEANGGSSSALNALNQVRERANMPLRTTTDQAVLRQQIRDERVLELMFEGTRYYDLLRWGMVPEAITDDFKSNMGGTQYQTGREYLPVWQTEIDTNPNYPQNPGY